MRVFGAPIHALIGASILLTAGCSSQMPAPSSGLVIDSTRPVRSSCAIALDRIRQAVADANVTDAQDRPIPGFAFLRVNRFLARIGRRFANGRPGPAFEAWVDRLQALEREGLQVELANLGNAGRRRLARTVAARGTAPSDILAKASQCGQRARQRALATAAGRRRLVQAARVADNYSDTAQLLGAYPLTSIPVNLGWQRWKAQNLASFERPPSDQPVIGRVVEFRPPSSPATLNRRAVRSLIRRSRRSPLGIPEPRGASMQRLLHTFAPVWQVDVAGRYDKPGFPTWRRKAGTVYIDVERAVTFTRISHAIVDNKVHLQLNYAIWFEQRPAIGPLDLLSGNLDGVVWRVTLGDDGRPLIYDSIHLCGCYHFLFPVSSRFSKNRAERNPSLKEVPAVIAGFKPPTGGQRVTLRLASGSHYLLAVKSQARRRTTAARRTYRYANETILRSLPLSGARRRSLYRSDGLIAGTERLERFVLWPTGVVSPGALRQWGHHAIAFADRRHFDDPLLFDIIFGR
ncbi:MAG: hypothetical protein ACR2PI_20155 [Hyphomicrobiaceae bacterium]